jgi:hypothetical protein
VYFDGGCGLERTIRITRGTDPRTRSSPLLEGARCAGGMRQHGPVLAGANHRSRYRLPAWLTKNDRRDKKSPGCERAISPVRAALAATLYLTTPLPVPIVLLVIVRNGANEWASQVQSAGAATLNVPDPPISRRVRSSGIEGGVIRLIRCRRSVSSRDWPEMRRAVYSP